MDFLQGAAYIFQSSQGFIITLVAYGVILARKIIIERNTERRWSDFHIRIVVGTIVIGLGFLVEPIVWGLIRSWKSDLWFEFSRGTIISWLESVVEGGLLPGIVAAAAAGTRATDSRRKYLVIFAVIGTLLFGDIIRYASAILISCRLPGEFTWPSFYLFAVFSNIFGGFIGGWAFFVLSERAIQLIDRKIWNRAKDWYEAIPKSIRWAVLSGGSIFLTPILVTRALPFFGLELAQSISFLKLSREAYLDFEILSPNGTNAFGFLRPVILVSNLRAKPYPDSDKHKTMVSRAVTIRLKYPETRKLKIYDLSVRQFAQRGDGKAYRAELKCSKIPPMPLELDDSRLEITCELNPSLLNALRPLTSEELNAMAALLPAWGKDWLSLRDAKIQIKYTTASRERQVDIPVDILSPSIDLQKKIDSDHRARHLLEKEFVERAGHLKSKASLLRSMGKPLEIRRPREGDGDSETIVYSCRGAVGARFALCRWIFRIDAQGRVRDGEWSNPELQALRAAGRKFHHSLSEIKNQGELINRFGEPYLKIRDEWLYLLPEDPEEVMYRLSFRGDQTIKSISPTIR